MPGSTELLRHNKENLKPSNSTTASRKRKATTQEDVNAMKIPIMQEQLIKLSREQHAVRMEIFKTKMQIKKAELAQIQEFLEY